MENQEFRNLINFPIFRGHLPFGTKVGWRQRQRLAGIQGEMGGMISWEEEWVGRKTGSPNEFSAQERDYKRDICKKLISRLHLIYMSCCTQCEETWHFQRIGPWPILS